MKVNNICAMGRRREGRSNDASPRIHLCEYDEHFEPFFMMIKQFLKRKGLILDGRDFLNTMMKLYSKIYN